MLSILALAAVAGATPVEARVTSIDLQRPVGMTASWYNRINVELESADQRQVRLCPGDVSVLTERRVDDGFRPVDRFRAHAMSLGSTRSYAAGCRDITLAPGRPQAVTFLVAAVPGGRHRGEDRYTLVLNAN